MPRGGRRHGAGAPVGNMNALKTGTRSLRVRAILMALLRDDEARAVLLRLGARRRAKHAAVRELTIAMARLMHDEPIAVHARRLLDEAAGRTLAEHDALDIRRNIARSEQASGCDAETGRPLDRPPLRTPEQLGEVSPAVCPPPSGCACSGCVTACAPRSPFSAPPAPMTPPPRSSPAAASSPPLTPTPSTLTTTSSPR